MTNASMTFGRPTRVVFPRGALALGGLAAWLINALRRLDRWQLSRQQEEPQTAAEVLAWADRLQHSEPSFAADLRSAALRAEAQVAGVGR